MFHHIKNHKIITFIFLLVSCQFSIANDVETILFGSANKALITANSVNANLLAPDSYNKASGYYKQAQEKFDKGQSMERIKKDLANAETNYKKAIEATQLAELTLAHSITARNGAVAASAEKYAKDAWDSAEDTFYNAASRLEDGKVKSASKLSEKAATLYNEAELLSIKNHYLNSSRDLVKQAKKEKANKYAPKTLTKAEQLLEEAEKALDENRYDLDKPRSLAKEAMYEAGHAIKITHQVLSVIKDDITREELILAMESPIVHIADTLDVKAKFDDSVDNPIDSINKKINALQNNSLELDERKKEISNLENNIAQLENKLGIQSDRLANQEIREQKLRKVESLFSEEEAIVLKKGDSIIIRMVGLNFNSGKSNIESEYFNLLRKVQAAIEIFPSSDVTIEGHTDSFGTDSLNLSLSQQRADAVRSYLQANMKEKDDHIMSAQGFGETKPIGNNETEDGRRRNRRIDLVIKG